MKRLVMCAAVLLLWATRVQADPILMDQGRGVSQDISDLFVGDWNVSGPDFSLNGRLRGPILGMPCPCEPGIMVPMDHRAQLFGQGDVTLDGQTFTGLLLQATVNVRSPTTVLLPSNIVPGNAVAFAFEFLLSGHLVGRSNGEIVIDLHG